MYLSSGFDLSDVKAFLNGEHKGGTLFRSVKMVKEGERR